MSNSLNSSKRYKPPKYGDMPKESLEYLHKRTVEMAVEIFLLRRFSQILRLSEEAA